MYENHKKIAADLLKCGVSRIKVTDDKQFGEALTRQDIRNLIRKGVVYKIQKKGTSKAFSKKTLKQKKKGRRKGPGSRRGTYGARNPSKTIWVAKVRALRGLLNEVVANGQVDKANYRKLYMMIKGGVFRSRKNMLNYLKDHEMLKSRKDISGKKKKAK